MRPGRGCHGLAGEFHSFSRFRYNFHQRGFCGVVTGTSKAADNFLDGAGFAFAFAITKPKGRSSRSARKKPVIEKSLSGSATVDGSVPINGLGGN